MYKKDSGWNDMVELECFYVARLVEVNKENGLQARLCKNISEKNPKLTQGSISAKVTNFKSLMGIVNDSNASLNSKRIYNKYKDFSLEEINREINKEDIVEVFFENYIHSEIDMDIELLKLKNLQKITEQKIKALNKEIMDRNIQNS